jgi:NarL family two-component system sensor histidine kinase LiaS
MTSDRLPPPAGTAPSFPDRFRSLRWKLVFSYVGVTLLTVLALELAVLLLLGLLGEPVGDWWSAQTVLANSRQLAGLAADPLEAGSAERLAQALYQPVGLVLKAWIAQDPEPAQWLDETRVVVDMQGTIAASNLPERYPAGSPFRIPGFPQAEHLVESVIAGGGGAGHLSKDLNVFAAAAPITADDGRRIGVLYIHQPRTALALLSPADLFGPLATTTLLLLPCMIPLGLVFAFVTATGFTRRLQRLSDASRALAEGDLSRRVKDDSGDEIGRLSRQFNRMAEQLQAGAVRLRELAAVEERRRLARDLHDGIKQNLFGTSLAAAAAVNLLDSDPQAAREKILEAAEHNRSAQDEMKVLLEELRPAGFGESGLPSALEEYLSAFGARHGLKVSWTASGQADLPPDRQQALFRITQEALSNVHRHARAGRVSMEWAAGPEEVTLRIEDDGRGFDSEAAAPPQAAGLRGIRDRLAEFGGGVEIDSAPGCGTRLTVRLPASGRAERKDSHA